MFCSRFFYLPGNWRSANCTKCDAGLYTAAATICHHMRHRQVILKDVQGKGKACLDRSDYTATDSGFLDNPAQF